MNKNMGTNVKQLPLGIQNLPEIIEKKFLYVDKTPLALDIIQKGKHYFLSRPRRFGKSLFLSTLQHIFQADKELFKGLGIEKSDYKWEKHPVIHLSFGSLNHDSTKQFEIDIKDTLGEIAKSYGVSITGSSIQLQLSSLVKNLGEINSVVVLIDEYDKPILDHLKEPELVEGNRKVMRVFFGTLKDLDPHLRFTFVTGISRFSRASLFSGFNNLKDISFNQHYTAITGYTEEELNEYFTEYVNDYAIKKKETPQEVRKLLKTWYNGYRFTKSSLRVYNPYSILSFFDDAEVQNYWYRSGSPTFLINQFEKFPDPITTLEGIKLPEESLCEIRDVNNINLPSLMFQAGYLTIQSYSEEKDCYTLEFPNEEVRKSFFKSLLIFFSGTSVAFDHVVEVKKAFEEDNIPLFIESVNAHLLNLCYDFFDKAQEKFFHGILVSILELCMIKTSSEQHTLTGRIDLLIEREKVIYIMEFKLDKSAKEAIDQIKEKRYLDGFFNRGKKVVAIGLNFDSKKRQITDYLIEKYSEGGKLS